jgi:hypothetical protein
MRRGSDLACGERDVGDGVEEVVYQLLRAGAAVGNWRLAARGADNPYGLWFELPPGCHLSFGDVTARLRGRVGVSAAINGHSDDALDFDVTDVPGRCGRWLS